MTSTHALPFLLLLLLLTITTTTHASTCTDYSEKNDCSPFPAPLKTPLPACGSFSTGSNVSHVFLVLGDYGLASAQCEAHVAQLVHALETQFGGVEFILTTGDNAYWNGQCSSLDESVGQYYSTYFPRASRPCVNPTGFSQKLAMRRVTQEERDARRRYPSGGVRRRQLLSRVGTPDSAGASRFFPTLGNHDWDYFSSHAAALPYLQYFEFLGNLSDTHYGGQYYRHTPVPGVEIFSLNSNLGAPGSTEAEKLQHKEMVAWLSSALPASRARFKFVYFHHPPFCTAEHDPLAEWMDLPYAKWGATAILAGHEHVYERMVKEGGLTYIVNGLGGHPWLYEIHNCDVQSGSMARYNTNHGVMLGLVANDEVTMCFYSTENGGTVVDEFTLRGT